MNHELKCFKIHFFDGARSRFLLCPSGATHLKDRFDALGHFGQWTSGFLDVWHLHAYVYIYSIMYIYFLFT